MDPQDVEELRRMVERCIRGHVAGEVIAPQLAILLARYFESNYQAGLRGDPSLPSFMPALRTMGEKQRLRALCDTLLDQVSDGRPVIEYLTADEGGAV